MSATSKKKLRRKISIEEFDDLAERGKDITPYLDFSRAVVVRRVNVDFPQWMLDALDREALKLNVSRQAVIKMWLHDRIQPKHEKMARERLADLSGSGPHAKAPRRRRFK